MKKRICLFFGILLGLALLVAGAGGYLKYGLFPSIGMETQENVISLPFVLLTDPEMSYSLSYHWELAHQEPAQPEETEGSEPLPTEETTQPVPETEAPTQPEETEAPAVLVDVDESWFDDALFIGESRVESLRAYHRMGESEFFCSTNQTVYGIRSVKLSDTHFAGWKLRQVLSMRTYGKIIFHFGINECAGDVEMFLSSYRDLIELVRELQPDAVIILQSIIPVTESYSSRKYFRPESLAEWSDQIKALAQETGCYFIDLREWSADENGWLLEAYTNDGCHPNSDGCEKWAAWLVEQAYRIENGLLE